eukprot:scaffold16409_cov30-Tisochrysis_lutea.AAC.2
MDRVEYFKGSKLIDALVGPKYKGKLAQATPIKSRADAAKVGQTLLSQGYFHRSQRVTHAHSRRWELELVSGPFEEDGVYTWVYEGSKTKLYFLTGAMLLGALGLCMIQIWPLWMKIGVWWCSVTFLTTFGILCIVRLMLFILMWIIGFRGIWLFPNLFDDNQTFAGSFMPIFGKGDPIIIYEDSDEEYNEYLRKKSKKKDSKDGKSGDSNDGKKVVRKKASEAEDDAPKWQFGLINIIIIFGIGALWCLQMGFFDGENVPDFVAKRDDLQYYFKGLAAPEPTNDTKCACHACALGVRPLLTCLALTTPAHRLFPACLAGLETNATPLRRRMMRNTGGFEPDKLRFYKACCTDGVIFGHHELVRLGQPSAPTRNADSTRLWRRHWPVPASRASIIWDQVVVAF